jgi:serine/threonine-protein kinase
VCRVLDVGRLDSGAPYIMMELLEGADLSRAVAQRPLPVMIAVEYILQACVALVEAHAAGIIHRDLKPANLFVTRRADGGPLVKVLDFGIAKAMTEEAQLTHASGMLGSPGYMSPEQLMSPRDVDARTDIWALGVTLCQLVSGRLPFMAASPTEVAIKIASEPPSLHDIDPPLAAVLARCLAKPREERYPDVAAFAAALLPFGGPGAARVAAELGYAAPRSQVLAAAPAVSATAMTAAGTAASVAPFAAAPGVAAPARPRRAMWITAAVAFAAITGVVVWAATRQSAPPAPADAAAVAPVAPVAPPPADAAAPIATAPPPDAAPPADAATIEVAIPAPYEEQIKKSRENARVGCKNVMGNPQVMKMAPQAVAMCGCVLGDPARAKEALEKLPEAQRDSIRAACRMYGVPL